MLIESISNKRIKLVRKLDKKKFRDVEGLYVIESIKLVIEAIRDGLSIKFILIDETLKDDIVLNKLEDIVDFLKKEIEICFVKKDIFKLLSNTVNSQGIIAVVEKSIITKEQIFQSNFIIFCDDIQDPGNLGTIIRTADAFGPCTVVMSPCSVDYYNSKVIRACAGAMNRIKITEITDSINFLKELKLKSYKIISTVVNSNKSFEDLENFNKVCLIIGNEGNGVSENVQDISDYKITIKMTGNTESLNASIAAGISIYEIRKKLLK